ncbi:MAG: hypothetical protein J2P57_01365 [Acidimicrobiaceae bacterium]|nr:hypothetical protein [Acidimicrobiaceae bacterium]
MTAPVPALACPEVTSREVAGLKVCSTTAGSGAGRKARRSVGWCGPWSDTPAAQTLEWDVDGEPTGRSGVAGSGKPEPFDEGVGLREGSTGGVDGVAARALGPGVPPHVSLKLPDAVGQQLGVASLGDRDLTDDASVCRSRTRRTVTVSTYRPVAGSRVSVISTSSVGDEVALRRGRTGAERERKEGPGLAIAPVAVTEVARRGPQTVDHCQRQRLDGGVALSGVRQLRPAATRRSAVA